jgi:hypothetical protein
MQKIIHTQRNIFCKKQKEFINDFLGKEMIKNKKVFTPSWASLPS